jgi:hypothetical protein
MKTFRSKILILLAAAGMITGARAAETVKVGVLHSLSGTMAISETSLKDVLLFTFDEINKVRRHQGWRQELHDRARRSLIPRRTGRCSLKKRATAREGQSLRRLRLLDLRQPQVGAAGLRTQLNGLLFYPVQYEGEELSKNIFYTAEAVNQQAIPPVDYMLGRREEEVLPARLRLRLSPHHEQDPQAVSQDRRAFRTKTSLRSTRRSVTPTTRPSWPPSRSSRPVARPA